MAVRKSTTACVPMQAVTARTTHVHGIRFMQPNTAMAKNITCAVRIPRIFDEYDRLTDFYLQRYDEGRPFVYYHFIMDLYRGPCIAKRLRGCGAGHEYMCVVPNGDIYPCHQFVGQDGYVIGNVYDGVTNDTIPALFRDMHVLNKPECCKCWAKFFCSGGCHANNIKYGGNIQTPYELSCRIQKKRIECAMYIQAKLAMKRQEAAQE